MAKTTLLFGIHMHQPVDNLQWVIEHAVEVCYGPFFEVMSRYPQFRFALHCSGWLMEQIEASYPNLHAQIMELASKGSIEFFSAGYYEPILGVIPSDDRVKQIDMLSSSIQKSFKQRPQGLWLSERVWESSLIPDLKRAGMEYTVMDDYHFQCAGFDSHVLDGYFMSEESGKKLALFPISKKLRYALPFLNVESAIKAIKSYNRQKDSAAIIFDDAEKFGMWPGTHEWVYAKGWLEKFVQAVLDDPFIETSHFGDYYKKECTRGIAYLPNTSYYEMGEWSLNADDATAMERFKQEMGHQRYEDEGVKFLKGGIWKNFFVKYAESNRIHKRMLELTEAEIRRDSPDFNTNLYKLQTNDVLWHGVFGGLYLPSLRDNAYRYLISCENLRYSDELLLVSDQNELDGHEKIKVVNAHYIFRFDAAHGGQLVEFDSREECFNWQNTLTRRKEAYHQRLLENKPSAQTPPAENGIDTIHNAALEIDDTLRDEIIYDWYLKNSFIDHISDKNFNTDNFRHCNFIEYGDFANQPFDVSHDQTHIRFSRKGGLHFPQKVEAYLEKTYAPKSRGFDFEITLSTEAEGTFNYVLEHNFHFADYNMLAVNGELLAENGRYDQTNRLEIYDMHLKKRIIIKLDRSCDICYFSLKTLSQSEKGFDLSSQGVSFAMVVPFEQHLLLKGSLEVEDV